jgi:glycosyltransferase involved in cell wall biosynthesis
MKILVVAANYPHPGYRFSGIFNERSAHALSKLCERVEVLAPRPYAPPLLFSVMPRWQAYAGAAGHETKRGIAVYRPAIPVVPHVAQAFWSDRGAYLWCRRIARKMHHRTQFDAIISFDLIGAGGLAWRLGRDLGIAASGWGTGSDVRVSVSSPHGRAVRRSLRNLDLVFYQSRELMEKAAELLGVSPRTLSGERHIVLPRGIPEPPQIANTDTRNRIRGRWGIKADEVVVLYLGRISPKKGMLELLDAIALATSKSSRIKCVLVGSKPAFDDTSVIERKLREIPGLSERVVLMPECDPDSVWENFCSADIFAFPSHQEGMPNSLLEAMASGLPSIAFAIPSVQELDAGSGGLVLVPPMHSQLLAEAVLHLASSPDERRRIGEKGKSLVMARFMVCKNMAGALTRVTEIAQKRIQKEHRVGFESTREHFTS